MARSAALGKTRFEKVETLEPPPLGWGVIPEYLLGTESKNWICCPGGKIPEYLFCIITKYLNEPLPQRVEHKNLRWETPKHTSFLHDINMFVFRLNANIISDLDFLVDFDVEAAKAYKQV